uniref:TPR_REGION domain-containing protein n=2 Tax=Schistosoma mansoni TaxID=6183 RepID=A0A3Q0KRJ2_SCHMA
MVSKEMATQCAMYRIKKLEHSTSDTGTSCYKATDGSLCFCTVIDFNHVHESGRDLECCPLHSLFNIHCEPIVLKSNSRFRIILGNSPDTTQFKNQSTSKQPSLRSVVEKILFNCTAGDVFNVEIESVERDEKHKDPTEYKLSLRVDYVLVPPICGDPTMNAPVEILESDVRENTTADWNPDLAIQWLYRAWYLKERGSWLVNHHLKCLTLHSDSSNGRNNREELFKYIWSSAFACYSRALQLVSLAYWAEKTCVNDVLPLEINENGSDHKTSTNNIHWIQVVSGEKPITSNGGEKLNSSDYIDWDRFGDIDHKTMFPLQCKPLRLMFILLSNVALCQLKVGSNEYCARNCSHALYLLSCQLDSSIYSSTNDYYHQDIINTALFSQEKLQFYWDNFEISYQDIHKVLFRRAQSYFNQGKMDEAKYDLELCIELMKSQLLALQSKDDNDQDREEMDRESNDNGKQIKAALQASENLLIKVNDRMKREQAELLSRIRKRTHVNE